MNAMPFGALWAQARQIAASSESAWRRRQAQRRAQRAQRACCRTHWAIGAEERSPLEIMGGVDQTVSSLVRTWEVYSQQAMDMATAPARALWQQAVDAQRAVQSAAEEALNNGMKALGDNLSLMAQGVGQAAAKLSEGASQALITLGRGVASSVDDVGGSALGLLLPVVVVLGGGLLVLGLSGGGQVALGALGNNAGLIARAMRM